MSDRIEVERILLAEAVDRKSFEFLTEEGITPDYFGSYLDIATKLWGEPEIPSRSIVESWEKCAIKDWEPDPEGVPYAILEIKDYHAHDNFNETIMSIKSQLRAEDGWKTVLENLPEQLLKVQEILKGSSDSKDIIDVKDLMEMEFPPIKWVVPDIIPEGLTLMSGREKLGKSTLLLGLCVSVSTGGVALSAKKVEKGEVLGLFLEDNPRRLQKRIKKITLGSIVDLSSFRLQTRWPRVDQGGLEKLDRYLSENPNTRLVIIDTLKMWRSSKGSNKGIYDQDYESLAPLRELSDKHNTAILVTHHNNKAENPENPFDAVSGSTGLLGASNTNIVLQRLNTGLGLTFHIEGHDIEERKEYALLYEPATWTFKLDTETEKHKTSKERAEILDLITEAGKAMGPKEVEDALGKNPRELLRKMVKDHQLVKVGYGEYDIPSRDSIDTTTLSSNSSSVLEDSGRSLVEW